MKLTRQRTGGRLANRPWSAPRRPHWLIMCLLIWVSGRVLWDRCSPWRAPPGLGVVSEGRYRVDSWEDDVTLLVSSWPTQDPLTDRPLTDNDRRRMPLARIRLLGVEADHGLDSTVREAPLAVSHMSCGIPNVLQQQVRVQLDRRRLDVDGAILAYVHAGDRLLNEEIIRAGLARAATQPQDLPSLARRLQAAEREARQQRRGLWSDRVSAKISRP